MSYCNSSQNVIRDKLKYRAGLCSPQDWMDRASANTSAVQRVRKSGLLEGHEGCVNVVTFNYNGELLLSGSDNGSVKIWNPFTRQCLRTIPGHSTNVFAGNFFPYSSSKFVSGGNDSDLRVCDIESGACTIYFHHTQKVLKTAVHPEFPHSFLSCSFDGTVRLFDVREKYPSQKTAIIGTSEPRVEIIAQLYGGGRFGCTRQPENDNSSLIVDYKKKFDRAGLFSIDFDPSNGTRFIVSGSTGDIRLFDLRKVQEKSPCSYLNIYANRNHLNSDISGCQFSYNGESIVGTTLGYFIFVWDTNTNYEKELQLPFCDGSQECNSICSSEFHNYDETYRRNLENFPSIGYDRLRFNMVLPADSVSHLASLMIDEGYKEHRRLLDYPLTYKQVYRGHISRETIKGCYFWGPKSDYIVSGSDDSQIYIWDRNGKLVNRIRSGGVINSIAMHPSLPLFAASGLPEFIEIWEPYGPPLNEVEKLGLTQTSCQDQEHILVINSGNNIIQCPIS